MSFFERYFAALDGPDPYSSLDMVAEDVEFAIEWATGTDRKSHQIAGAAVSCARLSTPVTGAPGFIMCCAPRETTGPSSRWGRHATTSARGSPPSWP